MHDDVVGLPRKPGRTEEEALELGREVRAQLDAGGDWYALASRYSTDRFRTSGSVMATSPPGYLPGEFGEFLDNAELGASGGPFATSRGVYVTHRLPTYAACRSIVVRGTDAEARAKAEALAERVRGGEDFATLAREESEHPVSAARGGAWAIFERGTRDKLLKLDVFKAELGEIVGPVESIGAFHVIQRVPVADVDPSLKPNPWVRATAILLSFDGAPPNVLRVDPRDRADALALIEELRARILAGEDMAELARQFDDDPGGRVRGGDLGWIHREAPGRSGNLTRLWTMSPGELSVPLDFEFGLAIVRRDR